MFLTKPGHPAPVMVNKMTRNLTTVSKLAANSPFTEAQIRWWIFQADSNGLAAHKAVVRIGRRVYIDTDAFDRWVDAQQEVRA